MKKYLTLLIVILVCQKVLAQKLVDKKIDDNDRKKVEKARKLYNQYKIFEGEKILKDLVKQNPREVYFYEALVQMQRQVLYRIKDASGELQEMNVSKASIDSLKDEDDTEANEKQAEAATAPMDSREIFQSLGLDMAKINVKDEPRKSTPEEEDEVDRRTDATVTIDSSLIMTDEEKAAFAKDSKGSIRKIDKKTQRKLKILESFAQIPYDAYLYDMLQNARQATRLFSNADSSSLYLKQFLVDTFNVNQEVHSDAWAEYLQGQEAYYDKMIPDAAKHFEKALELDDIFYTAHLRLGDIYYLMNKDTAAILQYKYAAVLNPEKAEPYEKLAIMMYNRGRFTDAAATMIQAIMIYPQSHYISLLQRIVEKTGLIFDPQWLPREVFPLSTLHMQEEIIVNDKSPWWHYQAARQDVFNYFDTLGIVIPNDKTQERYLEVYAWKKMLTNASPKLFPFARAMEKIGYLDCYVLITLFHSDLYSQFKDFVKLNEDKIKKYYYLLINWEDPKFDKIRKSVAVKTPEKATEQKSEKKK